MTLTAEWVRIDGAALTLLFALARGGSADVVYCGPRLPDAEDLSVLVAIIARAQHESQPDLPPCPGLLPERKAGWNGTPAAIMQREGARIQTDLQVRGWELCADGITIAFEDRLSEIEITASWRIGAGDVISANLGLINRGDTLLAVERLASLALPVPARFTELTSYSGRWAGEMQEHRRAIAPDGIARQSVIGKPGFDGGNWLLLHAGDEVLGAHLAWSGDHDLRLEPDTHGSGDGRVMLQLGAAWDPGEVTLAPGESFTTPTCMFACAPNRSALAQAFHAHLRAEVLPDRVMWSARKVHLNSWEALGFDLSEARLITLAENAAALGVERFVLDDGWFADRRNDQTSLGDWTVSPDGFPNGLAPLISRVHALGMDFGLWVEPEMISPDSDLYRAHPDWCLHSRERGRPEMRQQLVLDLTRDEVTNYVFERLDGLLRAHAIAYLKWDHNRDLFPADGVRLGQTRSFYRLIDRLRAAHPQVEIESCSSGGGRIDAGVLSRTHRVWPSDNNDAIERLRIIPAWSQFLPLEVLGSHVGPSPNPITGRRLAMDLRAKVALFGHMGVEADPARMNEREQATLAAYIALYKVWRSVLHSGALHRLAHPDPGVSGLMVIDATKGLALIAQTSFAATFDAAPVRLVGLEPRARYRVTLPEPWPVKARRYIVNQAHWSDGFILSGAALMAHGLALPLTHPETAWLIALERLPD